MSTAVTMPYLSLISQNPGSLSQSRLALSDKSMTCFRAPGDDVSLLLYFSLFLSVDIFCAKMQHISCSNHT